VQLCLHTGRRQQSKENRQGPLMSRSRRRKELIFTSCCSTVEARSLTHSFYVIRSHAPWFARSLFKQKWAPAPFAIVEMIKDAFLDEILRKPWY
jgi:hypothetical protein